jgi:outer membrane lipoprotein-sorting protein
LAHLADLEARATQILEKSKNAIDKFEGIEAEFTMVIEVPDQDKLIQKGKLIQQGEKYKLDLPDRNIICNGQSVWSYLKDINEVHINDVEEADKSEFATPLDWMKIYENNDFVYALVNQINAQDKVVDQIEFKSTDRQAEFSKIRLSVDQKSMPNMLEFFYKDGVKMTLHLNSMYSYFNAAPDFFTFDPTAYPGVHVEDLRF